MTFSCGSRDVTPLQVISPRTWVASSFTNSVLDRHLHGRIL